MAAAAVVSNSSGMPEVPTLVVAARRPPLQYQRSVCELLAGDHERVTLRGSGRAAAVALILAAQMEARHIVTVRKVSSCMVTFPEDGRAAALTVEVGRHPEWRGSRYIPTFISFATVDSLTSIASGVEGKPMGSVAFSADPDCAMASAQGMTMEKLQLAALEDSDEALPAVMAKQMLQTLATRPGPPAAPLEGEDEEELGAPLFFGDFTMPPTPATPSPKETSSDAAGVTADAAPIVAAEKELLRGCFARVDDQGDGAALFAVYNDKPHNHRNNIASVVVILPAPTGTKEEWLRNLSSTGRTLIEGCCDMNGLVSRGGRLAKLAVLRVRPFGFAEGEKVGATRAEVAEAIVRGIDKGFHLNQAPRIQFVLADGQEEIKQAWMTYAGIDTVLETTEKFRRDKTAGGTSPAKRRNRRRPNTEAAQQTTTVAAGPSANRKKRRGQRRSPSKAEAMPESSVVGTEVSTVAPTQTTTQ